MLTRSPCRLVWLACLLTGLGAVLFGLYGLIFLSTVAFVVGRLCFFPGQRDRRTPARDKPATDTEAIVWDAAEDKVCSNPFFRYTLSAWRRIDYFLVLWFGLELAGYFALTPFCAVRRVMGVVVVIILIALYLPIFSLSQSGTFSR